MLGAGTRRGRCGEGTSGASFSGSTERRAPSVEPCASPSPGAPWALKHVPPALPRLPGPPDPL